MAPPAYGEGRISHQMVVDPEVFERQLGLNMDATERLRDEVAALREELPDSIAKAVSAVLIDPNTADKVLFNLTAAARKSAAEHTGNFVWSAIRSVLTHWVVVGAVFLWLAKEFGLDVASKLWGLVKGA